MDGPSSNATALVFVTDDGYTAEVTLADVQVNGVEEIQVK